MNFTILAQIQELDKKLMELDELKGDLPEKVDQLKNEWEKLEAELSDKKSELEQTAKNRVKLESDTDYMKDQLDKYQEKIFHVKTNKEYDAITSEIVTLEQKIDEAETEALKLMETEEELKKLIEKLEEDSNKIREELTVHEEKLKAKMAETESEERLLKHKREQLVAKLDKPLLSKYERIRKAKEGIAVAIVEKYTCSGCYATIPAQTVLEIRKRENIIVCESCGRILITPEIEEKAVAELHI